MASLCSMERGCASMHKHFQMVLKRNSSSLLVLNKKIKVCLGWDESSLTGHGEQHFGLCTKMHLLMT